MILQEITWLYPAVGTIDDDDSGVTTLAPPLATSAVQFHGSKNEKEK